MDKFLTEIHNSLGITQQHLDATKLSMHAQPALTDLEVVDIDFEGRPFILISSAAAAWNKMKEAAAAEQITLLPFSGFRSYIHQKKLIERHLKNDRKIEDILRHIAIPGFSEHHSGRAIDIHADGQAILSEEFELTNERSEEHTSELQSH